jgi:two-component system chemotaxis response regulator CheY
MAKKILIVDDSLFMRKILKDILAGGEDYEILEAGSSTAAKDLYKKGKPDLTLLDIVMGEGEEAGREVIEFIMELNPSAKVVMISALGQDSILKEYDKAGAADYIVKPFNKEKVIETVKKYLD